MGGPPEAGHDGAYGEFVHRSKINAHSITPTFRHSKRECSAAERVIWKPALVVEYRKARFQIGHSANATRPFGMTGVGGAGI